MKGATCCLNDAVENGPIPWTNRTPVFIPI
jgi:hypothetical protein